MQELGIPAGLLILGIGSLVAVRVGLAKRPTFKEAREEFKETKVCDEIHKSVQDKIQHLPEMRDRLIGIETKIDLLITTNGKK